MKDVRQSKNRTPTRHPFTCARAGGIAVLPGVVPAVPCPPCLFFLSSLLGSFETPLSSSLPFQPMLTLSTGVVVQAVLRGERPRKATYRGVERCCKKGPNLWPSSPSTALRTCTATMCMGSSSANTQLYGCTLNWPPYLRIKTQLRCSFPATHSHMLVAHSFTWQASASYTLVSAM